MKVCPKCSSTYSDETLNFCLTDGVPLVAEEIPGEYLSQHDGKNWHTADTLVDHRFSAEARQTSVNPSPPTRELQHTTTQNLNPQNSPKTFYTILGVLLGVILVGGGVWWFSKANPNNRNFLSPDTSSVPKHAIVPISPEQDAQIKKELTDFMQSWARTNAEKNADAHLAHYANTLEVFYSESGKDKNYVRADRLRAYQKYDTIEIQVDNLKITPESNESATIVFDKSWTMKNAQKTSNGSVQQEIHVTKTNGKWLIDSEKDVKVYYINNRENSSPDNTNQTSNTTNQTVK